MNTTIALDPLEVADQIKVPLLTWKGQCHAISLAIVQEGIVEGRVARGFGKGIGSQHSWIATGDPYDPQDTIVDPTRWAWLSPTKPMIFVGTLSLGLHAPHGYGSIWDYGQPQPGDGAVILRPEELSASANDFLDMLGPLDWQGWSTLFSAPVSGWPAAEIIDKADDDPNLSALIPIDRVGMLTDKNPGGLYLRTEK